MLIFLAVQAFIFLSWLLWLERGLPTARASAFFQPALYIAALLWHFAQIVVTSTALGLNGALEPRLLIALNIVLGGVVSVAAFLRPRRIMDPEEAAYRPQYRSPLFLLVLNVSLTLLLLLIVAFTLRQAALFGPYTTDGLWYHLPMVFFMRQQQGFAPVGLPLIDSYPHNAELWQHWIFSFFENDIWLDLHQLPFLILMLLSVYVIGRRLNISRGLSYAAALLSAFTPVVLAQTGTELVDVVVAALLVAALVMLIHSRADGPRSFLWTVTFGAALGLLAGSKFTGLVFALVLFLAWLAAGLRKHLYAGLGRIAVVVGAALLCGGSVYAANLLRFGNPLYPYHIALPLLDLPGPYEFAAMWEERAAAGSGYLARLLSSWLAVSQAGYGYHSGGLGLTWLLLFVTIPISLWQAVRRRNLLFLSLAGLFVLLFIVTPLNYSARFVIFVVCFGALSWAALQAADARSWGAVLLQSLALLCAVFTVTQRLWLLQFEAGQRGGVPLSVCRQSGFPKSFIPAYEWLNSHVRDGDTVFAYLDGEWEVSLYCLWNEARTNRLILAQSEPGLASPGVLFIPRSSRAFSDYQARAGEYQVLFADPAVSIVRARAGLAEGCAPGPQSTTQLRLCLSLP